MWPSTSYIFSVDETSIMCCIHKSQSYVLSSEVERVRVNKGIKFNDIPSVIVAVSEMGIVKVPLRIMGYEKPLKLFHIRQLHIYS